ncbi:hypothetical protein TNCV_1543961 [Trichonephila clavipes]|nr:hypothetical protein TNCV_1543961 [Trichonephila clavipes]
MDRPHSDFTHKVTPGGKHSQRFCSFALEIARKMILHRGQTGMVSAADKGWRVYSLDPHPDAIALCSKCTPANNFLDSPLAVCPHKSLNSCRGVISETDLLFAFEAEILEGLADQGVTQIRRLTIKKDSLTVHKN